jgi:hypothetical protein
MISTIKDKFLGSKFSKFQAEVNGPKIIKGMRTPVFFDLESDPESDPQPIPAKLELPRSLIKRQKRSLRKLTLERSISFKESIFSKVKPAKTDGGTPNIFNP